MILEFIKHSLGLCGEGHPSVLWLMITGAPALYAIKNYLTKLIKTLK